MADTGNDQALAATFFFGTVAIAAVGSAYLYLGRGGVSPFFRDGPRLVLAGYFATSFLWALVGFIATLSDRNATSGCQVAIAFASAFDQLARILLEEFLFWGIKNDVKASFGVLVPQAIFLLRFVLGGVYVGVQRPQFKPVCVALTLVLPLAIAVLVADAFIVLMLVVRSSSAGIFRDLQEKTPLYARSRALLCLMLGLVVWISLSVPMILGMESFDLVVRTVLPALGSLVAIGLVAIFRHSLRNPDANASSRPPISDAPADSSPRGPPTRGLPGRDMSTAATSHAAKPFIVVTTGTGAAAAAAASNQPKQQQTAPSQEEQGSGLPIISRPSPGQAEAGVGGLPVKGQLFPPIRAPTAPLSALGPDTRPVKKATLKGGKLMISYPVLKDDRGRKSLDRIATVDLATAARIDQERRAMYPHPLSSHSVVDSLKAISPEEMRSQSQIFKRKGVGTPPASATDDHKQLQLPATEPQSKAAASSVQPSLGGDEVRRRSPRQAPQTLGRDFPSAAPPPSKDVQAPLVGISRASTAPPTMGPQPRPPPPRPATQGLDAEARPKRRERSSSVSSLSSPSSPRRSRPGTIIFTDPNPPPKIPSQFSSRWDSVELLVPPVPPLPRRESPPPLHGAPEIHRQIRGPLASLSRNGSVRTDIRPSRQRPATPPPPPEKQDKNNKVPVLLRQTNGIPDNPRAQAMRAVPKGGAPLPRAETVMFINDIEYDNPRAVRGIVDQASGNVAKDSVRSQTDRESVVNRPRPVPRRSAVGSSPLSAKAQRNNRTWQPERTETQSSTAPKSAGIVQPSRGPGNAGSLPANPAPGNSKRRSLSLSDLPVLPPKPPSKQKEVPSKSSQENAPTEAGTKTKGSGPAAASSSYARGPRPLRSVNKYASKFSVDTALGSPEDRRSGMFVSSPATYRSPLAGKKRQSSPVLPAEDQQASPASEDTAMIMKGESDGGSPPNRPPASARALGAQPRAAVSKEPMWPSQNANRTVDSSPSTDEDDDREIVMFMLDQSAEHQMEPDHENNRNEPDHESNRNELDHGGVRNEPDRGSWHRRVGEECPTFSDRKRITGGTRNTPRPLPPPLPLSQPTRRTKVVAADLSPLESPQDAFDRIQEQLRKLDETEEKMAAVNDEPRQLLQQRMGLLADLEMEMGMQENHWQKMRKDISRASNSTSTSSPNTNPRTASLEPSPAVNDPEDVSDSETSAGQASRLDPGDMGHEDVSCSPSSPVTATASQVQISRLMPDPAQSPGDEHVRSRPPHVLESKTGPIPVDDRTLMTIRPGSLTPPHSDSEDDEQSGPVRIEQGEHAGPGLLPKLPLLATSPFSPTQRPLPSLASGATIESLEPLEPATILDGPATRDSVGTLPVETSNLEGNSPTLTEIQPSFTNPWKPTRSPIPEPQTRQVATRPRTMRPPRRSRRMSSLPDILENPEPLLDKRGTLGLFQFPWGEKSDSATVPFRSQLRMGMGMTSGAPPVYPTLDAQVRTLQSQSYPSSFFDDYDDDETEGNDQIDISDDDDDEGDDDDDPFDEATLWEIASLLRSDEVPSRESLFPSAGERQDLPSVVQGDSTEVPEAGSEATLESFAVALDGEAPWPTPPTPAELWSDKNRYATVAGFKGLPQPEEKIWKTYLTPASGATRIPLRKSEPATITSNALWSAAPRVLRQSSVMLWAPSFVGVSQAEDWSESERRATATVEVTGPRANAVVVGKMLGEVPVASYRSITQDEMAETGSAKPGLWTPPATARSEKPWHLFQISHGPNEGRGTFVEPAAARPRPSPRAEQGPLAQLESTSLWSPPAKHSDTHQDWVSLSSIRPSTPGAVSSASGSASPFTDNSSVHSSVTGFSTIGSLFDGCAEDATPPHDGHGDWDAAMQGAARPREPASEAGWDAALEEAIRASGLDSAAAALPGSQRDAAARTSSIGVESFDVARHHPVFAGSVLDTGTSSGDVHPAATGAVVRGMADSTARQS